MMNLARVCRFVLPPAIVIGGLLLYRFTLAPSVALSSAKPVAEEQRIEPWTIAPRYDMPLAVTDAQLKAVLDRMLPPSGAPNTNKWVHALRLWGADATFDQPGIPSGIEMRDFFLRDDVFQRLAGDDAPPLFHISETGVTAREWEVDHPFAVTGSHHVDDLLATLAESGTPLDTPLVTRNGTTTVEELLATSLRTFHLRRHEYEWTVIAYARYRFPDMQWKNQYGTNIDVAALVDELTDKPFQVGPCNGLHRLEALVVLYRADEQAGALPQNVRKNIVAQMQQASRLLVESQTSEGYWTRRWPEGNAAANDKESPFSDRILVTGHQLEWLALAPPEVQPPRETIIRASQWLVRAMLEVDDATLDQYYGPFSHAARALSLWRMQQPFDAWKN